MKHSRSEKDDQLYKPPRRIGFGSGDATLARGPGTTHPRRGGSCTPARDYAARRLGVIGETVCSVAG